MNNVKVVNTCEFSDFTKVDLTIIAIVSFADTDYFDYFANGYWQV